MNTVQETEMTTMRTGVVYEIYDRTDPTKCHIGSTLNLTSRWKVHLYDARRGSPVFLYQYMRWKGLENFEVRALEEVDEKSLRARERELIGEREPPLNTNHPTAPCSESGRLCVRCLHHKPRDQFSACGTVNGKAMYDKICNSCREMKVRKQRPTKEQFTQLLDETAELVTSGVSPGNICRLLKISMSEFNRIIDRIEQKNREMQEKDNSE